MSKLTRIEARQRRHRRVRGRVTGSSEIPRLCIYRSGKHLYVQCVDDTRGLTLAAASTLEPALREGGVRANVQGAARLGRMIAERVLAKDIGRVVFDRGGFRYHGRVKALADAAREAGLTF